MIASDLAVLRVLPAVLGAQDKQIAQMAAAGAGAVLVIVGGVMGGCAIPDVASLKVHEKIVQARERFSNRVRRPL